MKNKDKEFNKDREFGAILEKIYTEIRIIGEDLASVKERVEAIFEEQGRQKEELFIIKAKLTKIEEILKDHDKRLTHLETSLK